MFAEVGENIDLLKYLILEGHIDDTYYQYISLFHSGRMSPKDNSFLIKIRAYNTPPPDFPLDNVAEVVASMRPGDFGQAYMLNRSIVDHLFSDEAANAPRIAAAIGFISTNFQTCGDFFRSYYVTGSQITQLVHAITDGMYHPSMKEKLTELESQKAAILAHLSDQNASLTHIRPDAIAHYQECISTTIAAHHRDDQNQWAKEHIRTLIERIELTPATERGKVHATLTSELGTILEWSERQAIGNTAKTKKSRS